MDTFVFVLACVALAVNAAHTVFLICTRRR